MATTDRSGGGVSEIRVNVGQGYRIYYTIRNRITVILLCGGDKIESEAGYKARPADGERTLGSDVMNTETYTPWDTAELLTDDETIIEYLRAALEENDPGFFTKAVGNCRAGQRHDIPSLRKPSWDVQACTRRCPASATHDIVIP